jgi:Fur family ferric uptake transcriptional regulator
MHHLICTNCGKVVAFEGCMMGDLIDQLSRQTNFAIEGHLFQIYGRCAACRAAA